MNDQLVESLLYRSEDPSVDFKAEQYIFSRLDAAKYPTLSPSELAKHFEDKKSELLKDILAMSNAWRDGPAYILIGFKENKPHPPTLVGIVEAEYGDDAAFQQFVASKVNKPLEFKYEVRPYQGKTIGVLTIPKQARPFFSQEAYGKVQKGVVYLRRGSSTMVADAAEIAAMGADNAAEQRDAKVDIVLENDSGEDLTQRPCELRIVEFGDISALPDYSERPANRLGINLDILNGAVNSDFWRDLATWTQARLRLVDVHFKLVNHSRFSLSDCKLEVDVAYEDGERTPSLRKGRGLRNVPRRRRGLIYQTMAELVQPLKAAHRVEIQGKPGTQRCVVWVDKLLAGETVRVEADTLAVLPDRAGRLRFRMRLLAHEIARPLSFEQAVTVDAMVEAMGMPELQRFANGL